MSRTRGCVTKVEITKAICISLLQPTKNESARGPHGASQLNALGEKTAVSSRGTPSSFSLATAGCSLLFGLLFFVSTKEVQSTKEKWKTFFFLISTCPWLIGLHYTKSMGRSPTSPVLTGICHWRGCGSDIAGKSPFSAQIFRCEAFQAPKALSIFPRHSGGMMAASHSQKAPSAGLCC